MGVAFDVREGCQIIGFDWRYVVATKDLLVGRMMTEVHPGIEATPLFEMLRVCMNDRTPARMEQEVEGAWFELRVLPVPVGTCVVAVDITEAKRAQAVEKVARSVAHDLNNILSVVLSYSELILAELEEDHPIRAELDEIHRAGVRATDLTRQLLAVSRTRAEEEEDNDVT